MSPRNNTDKKKSVFQSKAETNYLKLSKQFPDKFINSHFNSSYQGFDILLSSQKRQGMLNRIFQMGKGQGLAGRIRLFWTFIRLQRAIVKGINNCFIDLEPYLSEIRLGKFKPITNLELAKTYPNKALWIELEDYSKKWDLGKIGFTELPSQLIFKDRSVLFKHALIFIQEMEEDKINQAPDLVAGKEVMRVYKTLGLAVNDVARWLRLKGVRCQSNHPLGGLVSTPPLAGKAGLGWQGNNGLLITPQFGQRQRIAPIFVENKIFEFTDSEEHRWIESFCETCRLCQRECPAQAIFNEKVVSISNVCGIGCTRTCIDLEKCFPYFFSTLGCSICVKVCPFSRNPEIYDKLSKELKEEN